MNEYQDNQFKCWKCKENFRQENIVTSKRKPVGVCKKCNSRAGCLRAKIKLGKMSFSQRLLSYNSIFHESNSVFYEIHNEELMVSVLGSIYLINGRRNGKIFSCPRKLETSNVNGYRAVSFSNNYKKKQFYVHRVVACAFLGNSELTVNHVNGIKDDNRLENLEFMTLSDNIRHSSYKLRKPKGVYLDKRSGKYYTRIGIFGKHKNLGCFKTKNEAQEAYDSEYRKIFRQV